LEDIPNPGIKLWQRLIALGNVAFPMREAYVVCIMDARVPVTGLDFGLAAHSFEE
jgi:hypothetical protein